MGAASTGPFKQPSVLAEQIAAVLANFEAFCSLLEIKTKKGGSLRFSYKKWNEEQKRFQRDRTGRDIVIKPRQIGFSTLELARDLWFAVRFRRVNVLVVVHDAEIKEQLFLDLRLMAECLKKRGLLPKTRYSTKTELVFAETGSAVRIVEAGATELAAQKKGRSGTIHRLHATEMAFWGAAAETWNALRAAVPDDGEVVIESTANGAGGLFYDQVKTAERGEGRYKLHIYLWCDHRKYRTIPPADFDPRPRDKWETKLRERGCDDQQIAWWRAKVLDAGLDKALQEYPIDAESCFRAKGRSYFDADIIDGLGDHTRVPLRVDPIKWKSRDSGDKREPRYLGDVFIYEDVQPNTQYVIGGDVSEGTGSDASAFTVIEKKTARTVATFCSEGIEPGDFGLAMAAVGRRYNLALLAPERNNHGHATIRAITVEDKYPLGRVYTADDEKLGWLTSTKTRPVMIDELGAAIRQAQLTTPDKGMVSECKTLVRNDKGKVEARDKDKSGGCKDDRFISWCIAFAARNKPEFAYKAANIPGM